MRLHAVVVALAVAAPAVANPLWDPLGLFGTGNTQDPHQGEAGSYVPTVQTVLSTNNGILGFGRHTYTNLITSSVWQAAPKATPKPPAANPPPAAQPTPPPVAAQPAPTPAPKPPSVAPPAATQQVQPPAQPAQQQPAQQPAQQQPAQQQPSQQAAAQATQNPLPQPVDQNSPLLKQDASQSPSSPDNTAVQNLVQPSGGSEQPAAALDTAAPSSDPSAATAANPSAQGTDVAAAPTAAASGDAAAKASDTAVAGGTNKVTGTAARSGKGSQPIKTDNSPGPSNGNNQNASGGTADKKGSNIGMIVGIVIGVLAAVILAILVIRMCSRNRKREIQRSIDPEARESLVNNTYKPMTYGYTTEGTGMMHPLPVNGVASTYVDSPGPEAYIPAYGYNSYARDEYGGIGAMPATGEVERRALESSIANSAFERAKLQATRPQVQDGRAVDSYDPVPPYWMTAGAEFGDEKDEDGPKVSEHPPRL